MKKPVKVKLLKHRTYLEKGEENILMELVYKVYYSDGSIDRKHIPKLCLPFSVNAAPEIEDYYGMPFDVIYGSPSQPCELLTAREVSPVYYTEGCERFSLRPIGNTKFDINGRDGKPIHFGPNSSVCYVVVQEKDADPVEMTVEEIEKKLGTKIKIVGNKEEK